MSVKMSCFLENAHFWTFHIKVNLKLQEMVGKDS